jgi:NifB/MoaA-like Fe-S oxidoreductase
VNDKEHLYDTIEALEKYIPNMQSVSIVPVGLSKFRKGLYPLEPFTKADAVYLIEMIEKWQQKFYKKYGLHFVHLSDEFYLLGERPIPDEKTYDGYLQYENGVGMARLFENQFVAEVNKKKVGEVIPHKDDDGEFSNSNKVDVVTGMLYNESMERLIDLFRKRNPGVDISIHPITNDFFGHRITVSGLLTGQDIIKQLKHKKLGTHLMLPKNILKSNEPILLDDISIEDIEKTLKVSVVVVETEGKEFYQKLTEIVKA